MLPLLHGRSQLDGTASNDVASRFQPDGIEPKPWSVHVKSAFCLLPSQDDLWHSCVFQWPEQLVQVGIWVQVHDQALQFIRVIHGVEYRPVDIRNVEERRQVIDMFGKELP